MKLGRLKGHTTLVPLTRANRVAKGVKVPYARDRVADGPEIEGDWRARREGEVQAALRRAVGGKVDDLKAKLPSSEAVPSEEEVKGKAQQARADAPHKAREKVEQVRSTAGSVDQLRSVARDVAGSAVAAAREQGEQRDGKLGEVMQKAADKADEQVAPRSGAAH